MIFILDIDATSYESASLNVAHNDLHERIKVQLTSADAPLFEPLVVEGSTVLVTSMCESRRSPH